jgi:dihydroflavonol-4-reductase
MVHVAGAAAGGVFRLTGRDRAPFCSEMARALLHGHTYDGSRATRDLGLQYTDIRWVFERTVAWLDAEGLV